ncbi:MAG: GxxExxY protein [Anaerolineales bacterium]
MEKMENAKIELKHREVTDKILHAFFKIVYPKLGYGFLEKVYENALAFALASTGLKVEQQVRIAVYFQGQIVGEYFADLLVEDKVIVELKATSRLLREHEAQLLNYLRATPYEVGLLLNFGPKPEFVRKAFDNSRKTLTWRP